jgi:antitoxin CcdA
MPIDYDAKAAKSPVELSLNEDLVAKARCFTEDLSELVENLLISFVKDREAALDRAIEGWNEFDAKHGSFADEYIDL